MNITLRKANALQNAIVETINDIDIDVKVELNEFQDPTEQLQTANTVLFENDARRQKLLLALYNIRGLVGAANAQSGIDSTLTKAAFIDRRIQQLQDFARIEPYTDLAVIEGKLEKIRNRTDDASRFAYHDDTIVITTVVSREQINQAREEIKNLKKQKQKINDSVLELNIKTEIPLGEDVVETLTAEGLL